MTIPRRLLSRKTAKEKHAKEVITLSSFATSASSNPQPVSDLPYNMRGYQVEGRVDIGKV